MNANPKPKIIADGDSWFDFPWFLFTGGGVVDHLETLLGQKILNLAHRGDATVNMLSIGQRQRLEREIIGADYLLFSGGGNDIAGPQLVTVLNQNTDGDVSKAIASDRLKALLDCTKAMYQDLAELRDRRAPDCVIVTHGYDFPWPRAAGILWLGPWMKPSMDYCGWTNPNDQRQIITTILRWFNSVVETLAIPNHIHVSTQGTLGQDDWHDEMHPNRNGFQKIAEKFRDAFNQARAHAAIEQAQNELLL